jgi:hypothetical protein
MKITRPRRSGPGGASTGGWRFAGGGELLSNGEGDP